MQVKAPPASGSQDTKSSPFIPDKNTDANSSEQLRVGQSGLDNPFTVASTLVNMQSVNPAAVSTPLAHPTEYIKVGHAHWHGIDGDLQSQTQKT
jgi:hypothetical protein